MCIFVVLCVDEKHIILYVYEYSDAIKLPKSYSPSAFQLRGKKSYIYVKNT
jgi:hypothetical protein